jgi:hypothetical protein
VYLNPSFIFFVAAGFWKLLAMQGLGACTCFVLALVKVFLFYICIFYPLSVFFWSMVGDMDSILCCVFKCLCRWTNFTF